MRDALTRHQQWCAAEGLTGPAYEQQRAHLASDAAAELDRRGQARGRVPPMPRRPPQFGVLSEDNMLAVPIRHTSSPGSRVVTEPIPDVGQAVLDRITALPRTWLMDEDPVAELHPDRHAEVGRRICNLIGP